jgi:3-hydroxybutyryl-CoA dehydratase
LHDVEVEEANVANLVVRQGLYFEEFAIGDEATSGGRTVTEADVVGFAALSGDWNAIHTDAVYASQGMFGERIAHGMLGLAIAQGQAIRLGFLEGTVLAFMELGWQFRGAIKIGDTIHMHARVEELKKMPRLGGGIVTFRVEILNQRDEAVQRGTWSVLVRSRA